MLSNNRQRRALKNGNAPTNVILLLDMSGSMGVRRDETIREVNRYLDKLREDGQRYIVTTATFNEYTNKLITRMPIREVGQLEHAEYHPNGWTRLLDAVGQTLQDYWINDNDEKTLFVVVTDGQENDSRQYSLSQVRSMIDSRRHSDIYGDFQFIFLGSGPDSWTTGQKLGFNFSVSTDWNNPLNSENIYGGLYRATKSYSQTGNMQVAMLNTNSTTAKVTNE